MNTRNSSQIEYDQILGRFSVRRYLPDKLDRQRINDFKSLSSSGGVLQLKNVFSCDIFEYDPKSKSSGALGAFGRIFNAPYFLAPYILGETNPLVDLGYRTQQIVLVLWRGGIGTCYIGCVHHQKRVEELLALPADARIASLVARGIPAPDQAKYVYQRISQAFARSKKRLGLNELFIDGSIEKYNQLSEDQKKVIEAGRQAPSATNAQPWRFKIDGDFFVILVNRKTFSKVYDLNQEYVLHDAGICMANISMAGHSLGKKIDWELLTDTNKLYSEQQISLARFKIC